MSKKAGIFLLLMFFCACTVRATLKSELLEAGKIVGLATAGAVAYGIAHEQVTVRVCPEYFTQGFHREMVRGTALECACSDACHPTLLACVWGTIASWWMGPLLGIPLALVSRLGNQHQISAQQLALPALGVLACTGLCSLLAGLGGYRKAKKDMRPYYQKLSNCGAEHLSPEKHAAYIADAYAHEAAYGAGEKLGAGLVVGTTLYRLYQIGKSFWR